MKRWLSLILALFSLPLHAEPERLPLWDGKAPTGDGNFEAADAFITVHQPENPNGAAIVICPGGGYGTLVKGPEGHGIAAWLNGHGITGIVLEYRLPAGRPFVPLLDARRALRTARLHATEWKIDPKRTGIIGFSAGGHLASTAGTKFDEGNPDATYPVERMSSRPDFMILVYPVITMGAATHGGSKKNLLGPDPGKDLTDLFSGELQVTTGTPPTYLAHAVDDKAVTIENSRLFRGASESKKVPAELLELPNGGHGLNGYKGPSWDAWQAGALKWLVKLQVIKAP